MDREVAVRYIAGVGPTARRLSLLRCRIVSLSPLQSTDGSWWFCSSSRWGCDDRRHGQIPAASGPQRAGGRLAPSGRVHGVQHRSPISQVSACHFLLDIRSNYECSPLQCCWCCGCSSDVHRFRIWYGTHYTRCIIIVSHQHTDKRRHKHTGRIMEIARESSWKVAMERFNLTKWFSVLCGLIQTHAKITTGP